MLVDSMDDACWFQVWCLLITWMMHFDQMHDTYVIMHHQASLSIFKCLQVSSSIFKRLRASSCVSMRLQASSSISNISITHNVPILHIMRNAADKIGILSAAWVQSRAASCYHFHYSISFIQLILVHSWFSDFPCRSTNISRIS